MQVIIIFVNRMKAGFGQLKSTHTHTQCYKFQLILFEKWTRMTNQNMYQTNSLQVKVFGLNNVIYVNQFISRSQKTGEEQNREDIFQNILLIKIQKHFFIPRSSINGKPNLMNNYQMRCFVRSCPVQSYSAPWGNHLLWIILRQNGYIKLKCYKYSLSLYPNMQTLESLYPFPHSGQATGSGTFLRALHKFSICNLSHFLRVFLCYCLVNQED